MKINTIILLSALTLPLTVNAANLFENLELAKKCHQLALNINELSTKEHVPFCKNKIDEAAIYTEMAAEDFISDQISTAKLKLNLAVGALAYTAVEDCDQANNILLAKNEVKKIYDTAR